MAVTFGATFAGVFASFLLWFGAGWLIRRGQNKKAREHTVHEIVDEIKVNIAHLDSSMETVASMREKELVPLIFHRLSLTAYQYAIVSGEIRLLDVHKRVFIGNAASICEAHNRFVDNTELVLAILLLRRDSLNRMIVEYRLDRLSENLKDNRDFLLALLKRLEGETSEQKSA